MGLTWRDVCFVITTQLGWWAEGVGGDTVWLSLYIQAIFYINYQHVILDFPHSSQESSV